MKTLLRSSGAEEVVQRIERIAPGTRPAWGKMSAAQMLAHCQVPLRVASGEVKLKRGLVGILFGGLAKKKLAGERPFGRNLPTAPEFRVTDPRDFATEKTNLVALIRRFQQRGAEGVTKEPHPFFGELSLNEWETLQWKHLDHHLQQFGV